MRAAPGWFSFDRADLDDPIFSRRATALGERSEIDAWLWIRGAAAWKPGGTARGTRGLVDIDVGQFAIKTRDLAAAFGWPETSARRFLDKLQKAARIRCENGAGILVISVCDLMEIPIAPAKSGGETAENRGRNGAVYITSNKEQVTTSPYGEGPQTSGELFPSVPSVIPKPAKKPRGKSEKVRWPDGFDLDGDLHKYATDAGIPFDRVAGLWADFKRYQIAKGNRWAGLKGWKMAWEGWVRREIEFAANRSSPRQSSGDAMTAAAQSLVNWNQGNDQ